LNTCSNPDWVYPADRHGYGLDWLAYSVSPDVGVRAAVPDHPAFGFAGKSLRPRRGYQSGLSLDHGRVDLAPDRPEQMIGILFTGSDLRAIHAAGYAHRDLLHHVLEIGGKPSRVDCFADVFPSLGSGGPADPDDLYMAHRAGVLNTRARTVSRVSSEVVDKLPERTIYIGSRASERLMRVYDKGLQLGAPFDYTRIELEMKRDYAQMWLAQAYLYGIQRAGCAAMRDFCYPDVGWYRTALAGDGVYLPSVGYRYGDTDRWLEHPVYQVLLRRLCAQALAGQSRLCRRFLVDLRADFLQQAGMSEADLLSWLASAPPGREEDGAAVSEGVRHGSEV
jgi:Putative phage replication protein RstA